ncbi:hypothetical protein GCM10028798_04150 [Humibacter antri]
MSEERSGDRFGVDHSGEVDPSGETAVESFFTADRAKAFIDAVVAIALTLLILPLLDAITSLVPEHGSNVPTAAQWFTDNWLLLLAFLISFVLIAMFWINHHRMFAGVRRVTTGLLWLNVAWLLTIVWLPVATAMISILNSEEPLVKVSYVGTMTLTSLVALAQELFLRAHPALHDIAPDALLRGIAVNIAMAVLFGGSLVLAILVPDVSYLALFLLMLTAPVARLIGRMLGVRRLARPASHS